MQMNRALEVDKFKVLSLRYENSKLKNLKIEYHNILVKL